MENKTIDIMLLLGVTVNIAGLIAVGNSFMTPFVEQISLKESLIYSKTYIRPSSIGFFCACISLGFWFLSILICLKSGISEIHNYLLASSIFVLLFSLINTRVLNKYLMELFLISGGVFLTIILVICFVGARCNAKNKSS